MEDREQVFESLLKKVRNFIEGTVSTQEALLTVCHLLKDSIPYYDWVGFYLVDPEKEDELVLGPYVGESTEHVRIPFGRGICGQAAEREETFIVQDVSKEANYLSCSTKVKSEIVVPIFKEGKVVGELDIDSHSISPFTDEDRAFLEEVCKMISEII